MLKAIIHNDDLGLNFGFTEAILDCFQNGITTSTSIRTNGTAFNYAIKRILPKINSIGFGLHLNLTDGKGYRSFFRILFGTIVNRNKTLGWVEKEFEKQFIKTIIKDKLAIDHINSERHIHMIPPIFKITAKLCKKYKIRYIRMVNENYYQTGSLKTDILPFLNTNIIKLLLLNYFSIRNRKTQRRYCLKTTDRFYGVLYTGNMHEQAFLGALKNALKNNYRTIEILLHPALISKKDILFTSSFIKWYTSQKGREIEMNTLKSKRVKAFIGKNKIKLINYRELN